MLTARYRQSKAIGAIAEQLKWTSESVKVGLAKARKALRTCVTTKMAGQEGGGDG